MDTSVHAFRLKAGYHLVSSDDNSAWLLYTPGDQWIQLNANADHIARLKTILTSPNRGGAQQQQAINEAGIHQEFEEFRNFGLLEVIDSTEHHDAPARDHSNTLSIQLIGSCDFSQTLQDLLSSFAELKVPHAPCPSASTSAFQCQLQHYADVATWRAAQGDNAHHREPNDTTQDVLIQVDTWQHLEQSLAMEQWCREHKISYLNIHREGHQLFIGPFIRPDNLVSLNDVQGRRLACADYPQALQHYQQQIAQASATASTPALAAHAQTRAADIVMHLVAEHCHQDVEATQSIEAQHPGQRVRRDGRQWSVDIFSASTEQHHILPLPKAPAT